jgi:hypothetical protein
MGGWWQLWCRTRRCVHGAMFQLPLTLWGVCDIWISFVPQGMHDVRLAYIRFALSFLIAGDDSTIGQVLELKGRYSPLFLRKACLWLFRNPFLKKAFSLCSCCVHWHKGCVGSKGLDSAVCCHWSVWQAFLWIFLESEQCPNKASLETHTGRQVALWLLAQRTQIHSPGYPAFLCNYI